MCRRGRRHGRRRYVVVVGDVGGGIGGRRRYDRRRYVVVVGDVGGGIGSRRWYVVVVGGV